MGAAPSNTNARGLAADCARGRVTARKPGGEAGANACTAGVLCSRPGALLGSVERRAPLAETRSGATAAMESSTREKEVPSELVMSEKWDKLIEGTLIGGGVGFAVGLAASMVLARRFS